MDNTALYSKLTGIFHDVFDDDEITLNPEMTASDVEGWDSLAHVRLILTIEKAFNIKFAASEIGRLKNVGGLAQLIQSKVP
jgi:acyl carrier protein